MLLKGFNVVDIFRSDVCTGKDLFATCLTACHQMLLILSALGECMENPFFYQNKASGLIYQGCEHSGPQFKKLKWLPVQQRINFKPAIEICKALNQLATKKCDLFVCKSD